MVLCGSRMDYCCIPDGLFYRTRRIAAPSKPLGKSGKYLRIGLPLIANKNQSHFKFIQLKITKFPFHIFDGY